MKKKIYLFAFAMLCATATMFAQPITKENSAQVKQDVVMIGGSFGSLKTNFQKNANLGNLIFCWVKQLQLVKSQ